MRCRDLRNNFGAVELFATRRIDPSLRLRFAQRLLRLREANRLVQEELASLARRFAKAGPDGSPLYGPENAQGERSILFEDPAGYVVELNRFLESELDVNVQAFGPELLEKERDASPAEIAALVTIGLLRVPEEVPPPASEEDGD